jgi:hypothetical protein
VRLHHHVQTLVRQRIARRRLAHRLPKSQRPNLPRELSNDLGDDGWRFPKSTHFVFSVRRRVSKSPVQYQSADIIWLDTKLVLRASDWGSRVCPLCRSIAPTLLRARGASSDRYPARRASATPAAATGRTLPSVRLDGDLGTDFRRLRKHSRATLWILSNRHSSVIAAIYDFAAANATLVARRIEAPAFRARIGECTIEILRRPSHVAAFFC